MDDDLSDEDHRGLEPRTPAGAAAVRAAVSRTVAALAAHAEAVVAARGEADVADVERAGDDLLPHLLAYADAVFDHTGTGHPLGPLHRLLDDDEDPHDVADEPAAVATLAVVQRHDYDVVDVDAVLAAGRAAYLRVWPDDDEDAAAADVTDLPRALYQVAHADGWQSLGSIDALRPRGGLVEVVRPEDPLTGDPDGWPERVFDVAGEQLFTQHDVWS